MQVTKVAVSTSCKADHESGDTEGSGGTGFHCIHGKISIKNDKDGMPFFSDSSGNIRLPIVDLSLDNKDAVERKLQKAEFEFKGKTIVSHDDVDLHMQYLGSMLDTISGLLEDYSEGQISVLYVLYNSYINLSSYSLAKNIISGGNHSDQSVHNFFKKIGKHPFSHAIFAYTVAYSLDNKNSVKDPDYDDDPNIPTNPDANFLNWIPYNTHVLLLALYIVDKEYYEGSIFLDALISTHSRLKVMRKHEGHQKIKDFFNKDIKQNDITDCEAYKEKQFQFFVNSDADEPLLQAYFLVQVINSLTASKNVDKCIESITKLRYDILKKKCEADPEEYICTLLKGISSSCDTDTDQIAILINKMINFDLIKLTLWDGSVCNNLESFAEYIGRVAGKVKA